MLGKTGEVQYQVDRCEKQALDTTAGEQEEVRGGGFMGRGRLYIHKHYGLCICNNEVTWRAQAAELCCVALECLVRKAVIILHFSHFPGVMSS
jgi:activator of 2-hydroxyglutaryl-CoA dehydratase